MNLEEYKQALRFHDWSYDYSDDFSVYKRGKAQRDLLNYAQRDLDPKFEIWNSIAPAGYQRTPIPGYE